MQFTVLLLDITHSHIIASSYNLTDLLLSGQDDRMQTDLDEILAELEYDFSESNDDISKNVFF